MSTDWGICMMEGCNYPPRSSVCKVCGQTNHRLKGYLAYESRRLRHAQRKNCWGMQSVLNRNSLKIMAMILDRPGHPPSLRELAKACGIKSLNGIKVHLERLRKLGLVTWARGRARTLQATVRFIPAERLEEAS